MGIGDTIKGLFKKADTGAGGPPPVEPAPQSAEGTTTLPDQETKPPVETTAEVNSPTEPTKEPDVEIAPQVGGTEAVSPASVDKPEASPAPSVEGAQPPPETPEG